MFRLPFNSATLWVLLVMGLMKFRQRYLRTVVKVTLGPYRHGEENRLDACASRLSRDDRPQMAKVVAHWRRRFPAPYGDSERC